MTVEKKYIAIALIIASMAGLASAIYLQIMNPPLIFTHENSGTHIHILRVGNQ